LSGQRLSKDHSLTNPQGVKKPKKITAPITKLFGRVSRKILCSHLKTSAYSVFRHYLTFKQDGQQQTLKWIKKYPIYTIKHTAGFLMLWHRGFYQIPTDKTSKPDCFY